jgi:hypothetical protein
MRGFTLRALPVCLAAVVTGCFSLNSFLGTTAAAPPTPTHAYWRQASAILTQKAAGRELKDDVQLVLTQATALRELSPTDVDPALVAAVDEVVRCEEEVVRVADLFESTAERLKTNQAMAVTFADANRKASEAKKKLKALRAVLNARYGGGFAG